ncbi:ribosome biogenesis GTPase YlqF [Babesia caballi]|uniref:Ribosome biogenesis GTPase YlqF n=1 Tax=Babesia caballi TaxID=5871 RepID=A0AAV4LQR6_BABCB|nr:ribosome biogenesis GTPase YlqF [Babesia caballi]
MELGNVPSTRPDEVPVRLREPQVHLAGVVVVVDERLELRDVGHAALRLELCHHLLLHVAQLLLVQQPRRQHHPEMGFVVRLVGERPEDVQYERHSAVVLHKLRRPHPMRCARSV